jgi:hypothetical protein
MVLLAEQLGVIDGVAVFDGLIDAVSVIEEVLLGVSLMVRVNETLSEILLVTLTEGDLLADRDTLAHPVSIPFNVTPVNNEPGNPLVPIFPPVVGEIPGSTKQAPTTRESEVTIYPPPPPPPFPWSTSVVPPFPPDAEMYESVSLQGVFTDCKIIAPPDPAPPDPSLKRSPPGKLDCPSVPSATIFTGPTTSRAKSIIIPPPTPPAGELGPKKH